MLEPKYLTGQNRLYIANVHHHPPEAERVKSDTNQHPATHIAHQSPSENNRATTNAALAERVGAARTEDGSDRYAAPPVRLKAAE